MSEMTDWELMEELARGRPERYAEALNGWLVSSVCEGCGFEESQPGTRRRGRLLPAVRTWGPVTLGKGNALGFLDEQHTHGQS